MTTPASPVASAETPGSPEAIAASLFARVDMSCPLTADIATLAAFAVVTMVPSRFAELCPSILDKQPPGKPYFAHHERSLRHAFNLDRFLYGFADVITETALAAPSIKFVRRLNAEKACRTDDRFTTEDRHWSLGEAFDSLAASASGLIIARQTKLGTLSHENKVGNWGSFRPDRFVFSLGSQILTQQMPAERHMVSTLPDQEQAAATRRYIRRARSHIALLAKLVTLCEKGSDEVRRWKRNGFGACDLALVAHYRFLAETQARLGAMAAGSATNAHHALRLASDKAHCASINAVKRFRDVGVNVFQDVLFVDAWQHHKAGMLAYGRAHGGVGPDVESLLHARGSGFTH